MKNILSSKNNFITLRKKRYISQYRHKRKIIIKIYRFLFCFIVEKEMGKIYLHFSWKKREHERLV